MKRKFWVFLSLWLSACSVLLACGRTEDRGTTLETAAIVIPEVKDPTEGLSETIYLHEAAANERRQAEAAFRSASKPRSVPKKPTTAAPKPKPAQSHVAPSGDLLYRLAYCETGGKMNNDTGDPFWGYFQWMPSTWWNLTHSTRYLKKNHDQAVSEIMAASYEEQRAVAAKIPVSSWGSQFPACSRKLGVAS